MRCRAGWSPRWNGWPRCGRPSRSRNASSSGCTRSTSPPPPSTCWSRATRPRNSRSRPRWPRREAEWEAETEARERGGREFEETLKKQRQRENDEFEYQKALERKKAQDKYDEEQRLRDRQNREKQEALEKSWQEREAALKAREDEIAQLRKESDLFPKRLAQEVDRAVAEARRQAEQQAEQRLLVAGKDAEADRRVAELRVKTLEESVAHQAGQLVTLQKQLDEAKQQVQDIAVKAIEGASGARALAHVNQIAMEQARTRPSQG